MATQQTHHTQSDHGAVLVHVAVILLALMAFCVFIIDYGVLWAARRQAQNSADAGALAGVVHMFYDTHMVPNAEVLATANQVAQTNSVWAEAPVTFSQFECPPYSPGTDCVRVDVFRDQTHGNPLPMFFGLFVGRSRQDIRATATARVQTANATDCLKPWGVIDKWIEHYPVEGAPYTSSSTFDKYLTSGPNKGEPDPAITTPDVYIAPTTSSPGSGFHPFNADRSYTEDYGRQISLKLGDKNDFQFATGWFAALAIADDTGGKDYLNNIKGCVGVTYKIGDVLDVETEPGEKVGPTKQAVEDDADSLIQRDPGARWDPSANGGAGGVVGSAFRTSPRIVAVPLVNPDEMAQVQKGGRTSVSISNIMGFFVEDYDNTAKAVIGRLMTMPGLKTVGPAPIGGESAFMHVISLIR